MLARWKCRIRLIAIVAVFVVLTGAFFGEHVAYAQGGDSDYVDVAVILEVPDRRSSFSQELNIIVVNNGSRTANGVEVVVDVVSPALSHYHYQIINTEIRLYADVPVGTYTADSGERTFRWSIPELRGLQREEATVYVVHAPIGGAFDNSFIPHEYFGEITTSSFESEFRKGNNTSRVWSYAYLTSTHEYRQAAGNYIVNVSVDEQSPSPGDTVDFTVLTYRENPYKPPDVPGDPPPPIDMKVDIELTGGLSVSGAPSYVTTTPGGSPLPKPDSVSYDNGVFNVGTLKSQSPTPQRNSVTLPIRVADNATVHEQCLTATLTGNPPPGTGPLDDDIADNVAKICLGAASIPLRSGEISAFTLYPCVGITTEPCDNSDDIRVRTTVPDHNGVILDSGTVLIHVQDHPLARAFDSHGGSVNAGTEVSWQTSCHGSTGSCTGYATQREEFGVKLGWNRIPFNGHWRRDGPPPTGSWDGISINLTAKGKAAGANPPGKVRIRSTSSRNAFYQLSEENSYSYTWRGTNPWKPGGDSTSVSYQFAEFEKLGTYVVDYTLRAKHFSETGDCDTEIDADNNPDSFCGTETYTFHVGPMTELEVRSGGASSHVEVGQYALTVEALNNGPDDAPGAEVTIDLSSLPAGVSVASHVASKGSYSNGKWDIGALNADAQASTLTLILQGSGAASANARASISSVEDYTVCIASDRRTLSRTSRTACEAVSGASWHEGTYYEYKGNNNSVTVSARAGTQGTVPDTTLAMVFVLPMSSTNLVAWSAPQSGSDHRYFGPVRSYDIEYSDDGGSRWSQLQYRYNGFFGLKFYVDRSAPADSTRRYRVRARYAQRLGDWTEQIESVARTSAPAPVREPGVTVSPTGLTLREGSRGSYSVRLDAQPTGEVFIDVSNSNPDVRLTVDRLTFTHSNWNRPQTVSFTAADDPDVADDADSIIHAMDRDATSALEYRNLSVAGVAVTINDTDVGVRLTVGRSGATELGVAEGGSATYELALGTRPQHDVRVSLSYPSGVIGVSPQSLVFTPDNYNTPQTVTVTGVQDDDAVDDDLGFIVHSFSGGYADDVWLNVTVTDDDRAGVGGEVELALSGYCPGEWPEDMSGARITVTGYPEKAGGCFYSLRLNALPTGNVTVTVRTDASKTELDTDLWTEGMQNRVTFTPENWRDAQEIGFWPEWDPDGVNNNNFTISHSVSGGGYNGVTIPDIVVNVIDEDQDQIGFRVEGPHGGVEVVEGDRSTSDDDLYQAVFYMFPQTQPLSTVTVAMSSDNPEVTLSPSRLSFTRSNWDRGHYEGYPGKRVLVRASHDADEEDETAEITFTVTSSDADYHGLELTPVPVRVADDDKSEAAEAPAPAPEPEPPAPPSDSATLTFVIYHDPDAGADALARYNEAVTLLANAGLQAITVQGDVQEDVDRLAGVTNSVLPRFFLGDPTETGWTSQPQTNNGGLRWLKQKLTELGSRTSYDDNSDGDSTEGGGTDNVTSSTEQPVEKQQEPVQVAIPSSVTGLAVNPVAGSTSSLAVSWTAVEDTDMYLVQWKTGSDDYNTGEEATEASHTITGLTAGTTYTVKVSAIDAHADPHAELSTGEATGTTLAAMRTVTVAAVADSSDSLDVSWPAVDGATGYRVEWKAGDDAYTGVTRSDATATSERITGLEAETAYTVRVTALHIIGDGASDGDSVEGEGMTNPAASLGQAGTAQQQDPARGAIPPELIGLTVSPVAGETTQLAVSWSAVENADKYLVQWKTGSDNYNDGEEATEASHTITGLSAVTAYTVKVSAIDTDADPHAELAVGEADGTTLVAMGAVTVTAVAESSDSLDASWPEITGAIGYRVEWTTGDGSYTAVTRSDSTATSERITGLEAETAYTVRVTALHIIKDQLADGHFAEGIGMTNGAPTLD